VIHLVDQGIQFVFQFFKIHNPTLFWIGYTFNNDPQLVGMAVHVLALVTIGHVRQKVSRVKREVFVNFHETANVLR
jgi:hypothetical protein